MNRNALRSFLDAAVERRDLPGGALLVLQRGRVVFREGFGVADTTTRRPFPVDALCHLASCTKPFTATAIALLAARGALSLDRPIDAYLDEFAATRLHDGRRSEPPTLRHILSQSSGLASNPTRRRRPTELGIRPGATRRSLLGAVADFGLLNEPGTHYAYSGLGLNVAGAVVQRVTGLRYEEAMRDVLFRPLRMRDATFRPREDEAMTSRYVRRGARFVRAPAPRRKTADEYVSAGGGLYATVDDMARLLQLHVRAQAVLAPMHTLHAPAKAYGLGFQLDKLSPAGRARYLYHEGASGTLLWADLDRNVIGALVSRFPFRNNRKLGDRLRARVDELVQLGDAPQ